MAYKTGMKTYEGILTLIEELKGDMDELERLHDLNKRAWVRIENGADDVLDFGALAYTIHTIYGVIENYFLRISKFFENSLPQDSWHKFRNLYGEDLDPERTQNVQNNLVEVLSDFPELHREYCEKLKTIAEKL